MRGTLRRTLVLLALLAPSSLAAQFTTAVTPPPKRVNKGAHADSLANARTRADSAATMTMRDMKAWVDSAATALGAKPLPADTLAVAQGDLATEGPPAPSTRARTPHRARPGARASTPAGPTTRFRDGAAAPDTATSLPTIALLGVLLVASGIALLFRDRASRDRARLPRA